MTDDNMYNALFYTKHKTRLLCPLFLRRHQNIIKEICVQLILVPTTDQCPYEKKLNTKEKHTELEYFPF